MLALLSGVLLVGAKPAATLGGELRIVEVSPQSGTTVRGLGLVMVKEAPAFGLALRQPSSVARGTEVPPCRSQRTRGGHLEVWATSTLRLRWVSGRSCQVEIERPLRPGRIADATRRGLQALRDRWQQLPSEGSTESSPDTPPRTLVPSYTPDTDAAGALEQSRRRLGRVPSKLAMAVRTRLGLRHRPGGDGTDGFIDGAHLARAVLKEVYGVDPGRALRDQIASGGAVSFSAAQPQLSLRPGDLLFTTTYAGIPRGVSIYLGKNLKVSSVRIRGVVVDELPKQMPNYLYMVAVRPDGL